MGQGIDARDGERRSTDDAAVQRLEGRLEEIAARIEGIVDHAAPADIALKPFSRIVVWIGRSKCLLMPMM